MDAPCSASAAPAGLTVQVCFPGARAAVLDNLNRQREEGRLCDLSIQVQGRVFRAHRCVLAASSPYFHDQVLLKNVTTVSLPSVMDPVAFESVLSSAYTGQLSIVHEDIVNYVTVASFLQMWHIVDKCTEILKRPRPSAWGRTRSSSAQHSADSQLDTLAGCAASDYGNCEEAWAPGHTKSSHFAHDGPGNNGGSRYHGGLPGGEAFKQKVRFQQRGVAPGSGRLLDKNREGGDSDETQEKRRREKREIEADEGVGEAAAEKKAGFVQMGHCEMSNYLEYQQWIKIYSADFRPFSDESVGQAAGKARVEEMKDKVHRGLAGRDLPSDPPGAHAYQSAEGVPGSACPVSARLQWQTGPWSQQEQRPQDGEGGSCKGAVGRGTYSEIEDGTGQVSQRPLVPASPDFTTGGSEVNWPSTSAVQGGTATPASRRHSSPPSAFPPPSSPPTPSSSSSVSLAGAPYTGKVHFCHCGKAYTLKSMRDRHVKMQHLNLRPFGCPVCTKSFKMKHHLTKHLKTHGGLRPYECGLCGKKVIWRDSFLRHQARCEQLASSSSANGEDASAPAAGIDGGFAYEFEEGEAFLAPGGQGDGGGDARPPGQRVW
uniref:Zinc finger and BTB domain containing 22a n=1 Tax=Gasterosteus aculeatus TaxID=69293 RepID=G3ND92_GASAC